MDELDAIVGLIAVIVGMVAVVPECELLAVVGLVAVDAISSPSTRKCQQKFDYF